MSFPIDTVTNVIEGPQRVVGERQSLFNERVYILKKGVYILKTPVNANAQDPFAVFRLRIQKGRHENLPRTIELFQDRKGKTGRVEFLGKEVDKMDCSVL